MEIVINDSNCKETIASGKVVLIDFWATWCGPCRALAPIVAEVAAEYEGRVVVGKCNIDECDDFPVDMGIRSIPTLLYFKNGELAGRSVGSVSKKEITAKLDSLL